MARVSLALLVLSDLAVLTAATPSPELAHHLVAPRDWLAGVGADAAAAQLAGAALWLLALWTAIGLACTAAARLPGAAGRIGDRLARVVLPKAIYRLAAGATGVGLFLAPATALADPSPTLPVPAWPTSSTLPAPAWPTSQTSPTRHRQPEPGVDRAPSAVTVRAGDSLWRIAAEHLDAPRTPGRIAASWPRWYAANRAVIGSDPNNLVPGQVLHTPREES